MVSSMHGAGDEGLVADVPADDECVSLESSRLRWQLAIDAAGIGGFDWDLESGALTWDDRLIELFGYDATTFESSIEAFNARVHPDDLPRVTEALQGAIDRCGEYEAEYRITLPEG